MTRHKNQALAKALGTDRPPSPAQIAYDAIQLAAKPVYDELKAYPKNAWGLTPDHARDERWHELKKQLSAINAQLRCFSRVIAKEHKQARTTQEPTR